MRKVFTLFSSALVISIVGLAALPSSANALSGSQFKAGNIISDSLFYKGNAMTASQIQSFLNAKVPTCDTNGTKPYNGTTRKAYAASKGVSTPFICLKSYKQNTPFKAGESGLCGHLSAKSNRSAANIINDVAAACNISQKVLLVLLQKEQSLVTDDWPWPIQYRSATGYGCPDTAPCDSEYYGFFNQVYNAARQFKRYRADPDNWNHIPREVNFVRYNPSASCGGKNVFIENYATAGLYNYTPYQPNAAALNNLYGTGNSCSAYGNRNFWRLYNDWFGSTQGLADVAHPDGTLIKLPGDLAVYLVKGGQLWSFPNPQSLFSYGYKLTQVKPGTIPDTELTVAGSLSYGEGALIKGSSPTIYIIDSQSGTTVKRPFSSWEVFKGLGYSIKKVLTVPNSSLPATTGTAVSSASAAHPDGTLVRASNSPTVYLIQGGARLSIPSPTVLFSHGYGWSDVKTANTADNLLSTGGAVQYREGTLLKTSDPAIYIVDDQSGTLVKRAFANWSVFKGLRYASSEVLIVSNSALPVGNGTAVGP